MVSHTIPTDTWWSMGQYVKVSVGNYECSAQHLTHGHIADRPDYSQVTVTLRVGNNKYGVPYHTH